MNLQRFIQDWRHAYTQQVLTLPLFNERKWHDDEIIKFILLFYHARGHFDRFLWVVGSLAETWEQKRVVLANIEDEFGGNGRSHEQLYFDFGSQFKLNLFDELAGERSNLDFLKGFNHGHIQWLARHGANHRWAAFSAYETLDNVDYENLYQLAMRFGATGSGLTFFKVHRGIGHYDVAKPILQEIWRADAKAVESGFNFIGQHQLQLWRNLGEEIFG